LINFAQRSEGTNFVKISEAIGWVDVLPKAIPAKLIPGIVKERGIVI